MVCENAGVATPDGKSCTCVCVEGFQGSRCEAIDISKLQVLLDAGITPKTLIEKGVALDNFYGKSYQGGLIFELKEDGTGKVATPKDADGIKDWDAAKKYCEDLQLGGYEDWVLPDWNPLINMYNNLQKNNIGGFAADTYWSSADDYDVAKVVDFRDGSPYGYRKKNENIHVRAARAF